MSTQAKDIEILKALTGNSLVEIYGPTRSGKSFLAIKMCLEAVESGLKTEYVDSEANVTELDKKRLGAGYKYIPVWDDLVKYIDGLEKRKLDVLFIDSLTLPLLGEFAMKNQKDRGELMLKLSEMSYKLKLWTAKHDALCVIVAQDKSEISKEVTQERYDQLQKKKVQDFWLEPIGGKSQYFIKEIMRLVRVNSTPEKTSSILYSHACRRYGRGAALADLVITSKGVAVNWRINPAVSEPAPKGVSEHALADFLAAIDAATSENELGDISSRVPWKELLPEQHKAIGEAGKARKEALEKGDGSGGQAPVF